MIYNNIFYFNKLNELGGTETYLYEIAKKYSDIDITIFYDEADKSQLERLRKYVRCKRHKPGMQIQCKKAFYSYSLNIIDDVEAEEHIFVCHGIYQELGIRPPIDHPKLTRFIAVSQYAADKLKEYAKEMKLDIDVEVFYNPLQLEPKEKVIRIVTASRLADTVKGADRIFRFIEALDRYCNITRRHYIFEIFSDSDKYIESKNVVKLKPRVDVRPFIADADILVQLSNDMETFCYSINEALMYGKRIVTTPLSVLKELNIPEGINLICNWDMSNVDEIVRRIFEEESKEFSYIPPKARYEDILDLTKSNYEEEKNMKVKVRATKKYTLDSVFDNELTDIERKETKDESIKIFPEEGREWITTKERAEMLEDKGYVTIIEEIAEEIKVETAKVEPEVEKAVKKTTRKTTAKKTTTKSK